MQNRKTMPKIYVSDASHVCYIDDNDHIRCKSEVRYHGDVKASYLWMARKPSFSLGLLQPSTIAMYVIRPFRVLNYVAGILHDLKEGDFLYKCGTLTYPEDSGIETVCLTPDSEDDEDVYVASAQELEMYTLGVFNSGNTFVCPYILHVLVRRIPFIRETSLKDLFSTNGIDREWTLGFLPLLGKLHLFLRLQESYVYDYFLGNILDILSDAKQMLASDISDTDKEDLLEQTYHVMDKLHDSINDVSPFDYGRIMDVSAAIDAYNRDEELKKKNDEETEAIRKAEEDRRLALEKERRNKLKEDYLQKISSRSELLDYFNSKFERN